MQTVALSLLLACALTPPPTAQDLCEGNGFGEVYLEAGPAYVGGAFVNEFGSPNAPLSFCIFSISGGFAETTHPVAGPVCMDVTSPVYQILVLPTDATGNVRLELALPNDPALPSLGPFYTNAATFESGAWSLSKTLPTYFEWADSFSSAGFMGTARAMHRATALGQGRDDRIQVFVSGGGDGTIFLPNSTATTELYQPLDRSFSPGPDLSEPRTFHTSTLLPDGRVLIAGGCNAAGVVSATCEIYDHATGTLSPAASMDHGRIGHTATLLPDGRVLVAGGLGNYIGADSFLAFVLSSARDTAEIYDPLTDSWSPAANTMSTVRSGHTAEPLADGRVLLISGIDGGAFTLLGYDVPTFTQSCDYFDPSTNSFSPAPPIPSQRAFHGTSTLGNGDILVTGGLFPSGPVGDGEATALCYVFSGGGWSQTGSLPIGVAFHTQVTTDAGDALISGGYLGDFVTLVASNTNGVHDGVSFTDATDLGAVLPGASAPRGLHSATRQWDGSILLLGGFVSPTTATLFPLADGYLYTPVP